MLFRSGWSRAQYREALERAARDTWGEGRLPDLQTTLGNAATALEQLSQHPLEALDPEPDLFASGNDLLNGPRQAESSPAPITVAGDAGATASAQPFELTLAETSRALHARQLSPLELLESLLQRMETVEPHVRAWETLDTVSARRAAEQAAAILKRGEGGPLCGVPVGVKDVFHVAGLPTGANFPPLRNWVATEDSGAVARLRAGGAVIVGKTVTVQLARSQDPPVTRNPWNTAHTPGGSSSGSAAAVAARTALMALGTQTGGSTLRPASFCGVVGLKPTFGRISRYGLIPVSWSLDHPGILARAVLDAALSLDAVAGHDPRDPASLREAPPVCAAAARSPLDRPRLALVMDLVERADPEVRDACLATARRLESEGAQVVEERLPGSFDLLTAVHQLLMLSEGASAHAELHRRNPDDLAPGVRAGIEVGTLFPAAAYVHAQRLRRQLRGEVDALTRRHEALLAPTVRTLPPLWDSGTGDASFQSVFTLFGLPAISLPTGLGPSGLPIGVQLLTPFGEDAALFRVAAWCEGVLGQQPAPAL